MFMTHTVYFITNVPVVVLNTSFQGSVISFGFCHKPCDLASTIAEPQFKFLSPRPHEKLRVSPCCQHRRLVLQHEAVGFPVTCAYEFVRNSFVIRTHAYVIANSDVVSTLFCPCALWVSRELRRIGSLDLPGIQSHFFQRGLTYHVSWKTEVL